MKTTKKLENLPPYLFAQIDKSVHDLKQSGRKILALSKSDPDHPTPAEVVQELQFQAANPANHHYPDFDGLPDLRKQAAAWYKQSFGVTLDPETQILPLIGSKEGIVHICEAFVDSGDIVLVPDPAFPSYKTGTVLAGGEVHTMPLLPERDYLPDLNIIAPETARRAKLMFLNYPNNPTGATATPKFFTEIVDFAKQNDIMVCHDHAYCQTTYNGYHSPSFLQTPGAMDLGVEFFTFSKAFNMAGWRLGFVAGNAQIINGLKIIETHVNAGIFYPVQYAGAKALSMGPDHSFFPEMNKAYLRRLTKIVNFFNEHGWELTVPRATVYLWIPCPNGYDSLGFTKLLLDEAGVAVSPGSGFGDQGESYVRICVTYPDEEIEEALDLIGKCIIKNKLHP